MRIKSILAMTLVAMAFVIGVSSCSKDDDDLEVAVATQVAGSYEGEEVLTVMGEDSKGTSTYQFVKSSDSSVDLTIPSSSGEGMALPALIVKNITLTQNGSTITGKLASYAGTVINQAGAEKSYTVSNLTAIFKDKTVVVTYTLKYGNMPFDFTGSFTGTKK